MVKATIELGNNEAKIIAKLAGDTGRSLEKLIEQKINTWAKAQFEAYYTEKLKKMTEEEKISKLGDVK